MYSESPAHLCVSLAAVRRVHRADAKAREHALAAVALIQHGEVAFLDGSARSNSQQIVVRVTTWSAFTLFAVQTGNRRSVR